MRRGNNPLMSGNAFKILSVLILAPGNNVDCDFWGKFNMKKNFYFWFFLEFGAIIEFVGCRESEYRGSPRLTSV